MNIYYEEKDTLYISEQLDFKNKIDFKALKREGFEIFDLCKYSSENLCHQQIRKKLQNKMQEISLKKMEITL